MPTDPTSILYDHYKDTHVIISEAVKRRERLMLFVVLTLVFFSFDTIFPTVSGTAVNDFLSFKFGLNLKLDLAVIGSVVWFFLLIFTLRYFQVAVFIQRRYTYIHVLEDKLNKELSEDLITREGKSYLNEYPLFSDWMGILYTIIFPLLLLTTSTVKIVSELRQVCVSGWSFSLVLNGFAYALLAVSIALYLIMLHGKT